MILISAKRLARAGHSINGCSGGGGGGGPFVFKRRFRLTGLRSAVRDGPAPRVGDRCILYAELKIMARNKP